MFGYDYVVANDIAERLAEAERLLEEVGADLLESTRPADDLWPTTAFSLAAHARSHHRALLACLDGPAPRASRVHARPIVETAILMHYLAEEPDVRVWIWVADGVRGQRTMLREWLEAVEAGEADDAEPEELAELIEKKSEALTAAENQARKAADARGDELEKVELPTTYNQAKRDPHLFGLYTKAFRQLSASVHVAATIFTEDRYGEAMSLLDDSLDDGNRVAIRALAASVLAAIYADSSRALGRDELAERTGAVHESMTSR
jgi:hypothetical protein